MKKYIKSNRPDHSNEFDKITYETIEAGDEIDEDIKDDARDVQAYLAELIDKLDQSDVVELSLSQDSTDVSYDDTDCYLTVVNNDDSIVEIQIPLDDLVWDMDEDVEYLENEFSKLDTEASSPMEVEEIDELLEEIK